MDLTYRFLVVGSTDWNDEAHTSLLLRKVWEGLQPIREAGGYGILVHPTINGAPGIASGLWMNLPGTATEPHTLDEYKSHGKQAPFVRNKVMVDSGIQLCISLTQGTDIVSDRCAALAEAQGILTWRIEA